MTIYQALRSFFRTNRVIIGRKPRTFRSVVEYEPRRLYTQEEVAWLVDTANNLRNKALITFLAQSGQRVSIVVSLKIRHIELSQSSPIVIDIPAIIRNKQGFNVNKAQTAYKLAIGEDTKVYLKLSARAKRIIEVKWQRVVKILIIIVKS